MLKIENVEVVGWEHAIRGMRNPKNSWDKSDSGYHHISAVEPDGEVVQTLAGMPLIYEIGPNDKKLMMTLRNAGTDHRKFMRMIAVYLDITAPLYWWKEFDTYKVGTVANSCSTMHKIHAKEFTLDDFSCEHLLERESLGVGLYSKINGEYFGMDMSSKGLLELTCETLNIYRSRYLESKDKKWWWQLIQLLPSSYNQKRTVMLNYEVLANMYNSRQNHKLDCWRTLCEWMKKLPYSELITGDMEKDS